MQNLLNTLAADPLGLIAASGLGVLALSRVADELSGLLFRLTETLGQRRTQVLEAGVKAVADGRITAEELKAMIAATKA